MNVRGGSMLRIKMGQYYLCWSVENVRIRERKAGYIKQIRTEQVRDAKSWEH
jgi:hypothetical protein